MVKSSEYCQSNADKCVLIELVLCDLLGNGFNSRVGEGYLGPTNGRWATTGEGSVNGFACRNYACLNIPAHLFAEPLTHLNRSILVIESGIR